MLSRTEALLEVRIRGRARLALLFIFSHCVALTAIWLASLPWSAQWMLTLVLAAHALQFGRRYLTLTHPESIQAIRYHEGRWYLLNHSGWQRCWLSGEVLVTPFPDGFLLPAGRTQKMHSSLLVF